MVDTAWGWCSSITGGCSYRILWGIVSFSVLREQGPLPPHWDYAIGCESDGRSPELQDSTVSLYLPLWHKLTQFFSYPDPIVWTRCGIKTVGSVVGNGVLWTFDGLKHKFRLLNLHLFRYLQFRHALYAQFGSTGLCDLESLLREKHLVKALSTIYKQLFIDTAKVLTPCHNAWLVDFPHLTVMTGMMYGAILFRGCCQHGTTWYN